MTLSQRVVNRPVLILVLFALVIIVAIYSIPSIPLALMPSTDMPRMMVTTTYSGAAPETVEKTVTKVLESSLSNVQGIKSMTSTSSDGFSMISLEFDYGKDLDKATNDIRDKIERTTSSLPDDADTPTIMKMDMNSQPIIRVAIRGNRSSEELKRLAEDTISPKFEQTEGVSSVSVLGGKTNVVRVDVSQNRLEAYGVTISGITSALATQNVELGAGKVAERHTEYTVRITGAFSSVGSDIANTLVATKDGVPVRLKDVASVYSGNADVDTSVFINGEPGIYLSVMKQSSKNTVTVCNGIYKAMEGLKSTIPSDVQLVTIDDNSKQIRTTITDLIKAIAEGAILTMLFVFLFLRSWKSTVIIGLAIPICVAVTLLAMYFSGFTLNMMTMTGLLISIGNIVDSSIVILDNTFKYRERGAKPKVAAVLGSQEMMVAITAGILASMSVFLPIVIFANKLGMMGIMFKDMIFTIIISHVVSWVVAVFLVPVLASTYLPLTTRAEKPLRGRVGAMLDRGVQGAIDGLIAVYRKALATCLRHRIATVGVVVLALAGSLYYFLPRLTIVFSPPMSQNSVTLSITLPLGTEFATTETVVKGFASIANKELRGVKNVIATTGSSGGFSMSSSSNSGSLTIALPDNAADGDGSMAVQTKLRQHFKEYPSATFAFSQGFRMGNRSDIEIAITSNNYVAMGKTAKEIMALLKSDVPEILEPSNDYSDGLPQVEVAIDRDRAAEFGVSVQTIASEIRGAVKGNTATVYREGGSEYDVIVRLRPSDRKDTVDLERVFVLGSSGQKVPLSSLATVTKGLGPVQINRTSQARTISITANLASGAQANVVEAKIRGLISTKMTIPSDVYLNFQGSWSEITETSGAFGIIIILAILLVFCVMAGQYESFKDPIINLFTIPLMLIGVLVAYALMGQNLSMFTLVGIVMLTGIVVNNGILLVDYTNLLRGRGAGLMEACLEGGASRFRPVIMTAGATILGVIPLAFFPSSSSSMTQPIGLAVVGGLTSATFITLLLIPVIYYLVNKRQARREGRL
jgi:hydrophobic/amphiphilic exporter-1 (mainly G- bacteria), HAE1 family